MDVFEKRLVKFYIDYDFTDLIKKYKLYPDEFYFINIFKSAKLDKHKLLNKNLVYVNWKDKSLNPKYRTFPKT